MRKAIKIFLAVSIQFIFLNCNHSSVTESTSIIEVEKLLSRKIEKDNEDLKGRISDKYFELTSEQTKIKYSPMIQVFNLIDSCREKWMMKFEDYRTASESQEISLKKLEQLKNYSIACDTAIMEKFQTMMHQNFEVFDLLSDEYQKSIIRIQNSFKSFSSDNDIRLTGNISKGDRINLKMLLLQNYGLEKLMNKYELFSEFVSGRPVYPWTTIYPKIFPKKNCVDKGDYFEAVIGIGDFYTDYYARHPKIIVNGKQYEVDSSGKINYSERYMESGSFELEIHCELFNRFTNEVQKGKTIYIVNVK